MIPLNVAATLTKVGSAATGNDFASEQGGESETYVLWGLLICSYSVLTIVGTFVAKPAAAMASA